MLLLIAARSETFNLFSALGFCVFCYFRVIAFKEADWTNLTFATASINYLTSVLSYQQHLGCEQTDIYLKPTGNKSNRQDKG